MSFKALFQKLKDYPRWRSSDPMYVLQNGGVGLSRVVGGDVMVDDEGAVKVILNTEPLPPMTGVSIVYRGEVHFVLWPGASTQSKAVVTASIQELAVELSKTINTRNNLKKNVRSVFISIDANRACNTVSFDCDDAMVAIDVRVQCLRVINAHGCTAHGELLTDRGET